jgi:hypothetical protein
VAGQYFNPVRLPCRLHRVRLNGFHEVPRMNVLKNASVPGITPFSLWVEESEAAAQRSYHHDPLTQRGSLSLAKYADVFIMRKFSHSKGWGDQYFARILSIVLSY